MPVTDVDADFAEYVRARQHQLRQAAYLLAGDLGRGDAALTSALGELARRWPTLRDEPPDVVLRRALLPHCPAVGGVARGAPRDGVRGSRRSRAS